VGRRIPPLLYNRSDHTETLSDAMARGRQRIRQRGSRQQWAVARAFKGSPSDEGGGETVGSEVEVAIRPDVITTARCGLCKKVTEQKMVGGQVNVLIPYSRCFSCNAVRCEECWDDPDDPCDGMDEHEFLKVRLSEEGVPRTANFQTYVRSRIER